MTLVNGRVRFHFYATGITPAMVKPPVGAGSHYMMGVRASEGRPFDDSKHYTMHIPPNVPAKRFWDIYFSPEQPEGDKINCIQTVPGKGWNMLWRIYGPLDDSYAKVWQPSEAVLVK